MRQIKRQPNRPPIRFCHTRLSNERFDNNPVSTLYSPYMIPTTIVTAREIARNAKAIFTRVKTTRERAVVMSQREPQVAIVPLDDLRKLEAEEQRAGTPVLLDLAGVIPKRSGLPADLSTHHDEYTWE